MLHYGLSLLLLLPQVSRAVDSTVKSGTCKQKLSVAPLERILSEIFRDRLNSPVTYVIGSKTPQPDGEFWPELKTLAARAGVSLEVSREPTDESLSPTVKLTFFGQGRAVIQALMDLKSSNYLDKSWKLLRPPQLDSRPRVPTPMGDELSALLLRPVLDLYLSQRTRKALLTQNPELLLGDLVHFSRLQLLRLPDINGRGVDEIEFALALKGLRLDMKIPGWPYTEID